MSAGPGAPGGARLPRAFWALWLGLLVNRFATFAILLLPSYLVGERGLGPAAAGRLGALFGVGLVVAGLLGGVLADRFGRRTTMVAALTAGAASVLGLTVARSLPALAALVFLAGAAGEAYRPAQSAAVADLVRPEDRTRAFGLVYWGANLASGAGMLAAAVVARFSLRTLFVADATTSVLFAVWIVLRVPETRPAARAGGPAPGGLGRVLSDGPFVVFVLLQLAAMLVWAQWQLGLQLDLRAHGLGPGDYALLLALSCGAVAVLQPAIGRHLHRWDETHVLMVMAALLAAGFGVNLVGGTLPWYVAGTLLWTLAEIVGVPTATALVARFSPPELRGRYQGVYSTMWGGALALGPLAAGELFARSGGRALWLACVVVCALVIAGQAAAAGPRRRRLAARPATTPATE